MEYLVDTTRAVLLTIHLLAGGLAGAGPLVAAALRFVPGIRGRCDVELRHLAAWSLAALFLSLAAGLLSLTVVWQSGEGAYRSAALRFPTGAYLMLSAEWVFTAVLLACYLAAWRRLSQRPLVHALIALIASTNLLYHFPTLMAVLGALAESPGLATEAEISRPVVRRIMLTPAVASKVAHFWSLSFLVAGVAAIRAAGAGRRPGGEPMARAAAVTGLVGLALVIVTGLFAVVQLPTGPQREMLGGDTLETLSFGVAVASGLAIGYHLLAIASGDASPHARRWVTLLLVIATASMVTVGLR